MSPTGWFARCLLTLLGAAVWAGMFTFKTYSHAKIWPVANSHHVTFGLFLLAFLIWLVFIGAIAYALYCLVKAAFGGDE